MNKREGERERQVDRETKRENDVGKACTKRPCWGNEGAKKYTHRDAPDAVLGPKYPDTSSPNQYQYVISERLYLPLLQRPIYEAR